MYQFYAKMNKKRHQIRDFADFQCFSLLFYANLGKNPNL
jgi:hypothetical protein